jgi:predicted lysophospholipase L1 biosynthesis ABC-type transport system permease subunit
MTSAVILGIVVCAAWVFLDARWLDWQHTSYSLRPWMWALATLALWIVIFPVYLFARRAADTPTSKRCPHCMERVHRDALVCPHCQRAVLNTSAAGPQRPR